MTTTTISVRVLRAIHMGNERIEPGTLLQLVPLAAADAVDSGRCSLTTQADEAVVRAAVLDSIKSTMRRAQPADWPWRPA